MSTHESSVLFIINLEYFEYRRAISKKELVWTTNLKSSDMNTRAVSRLGSREFFTLFGVFRYFFNQLQQGGGGSRVESIL